MGVPAPLGALHAQGGGLGLGDQALSQALRSPVWKSV